jgi:hypothetical protein
MSQAQREYVKCFAASLDRCKAMNLGAQASYDLATREARRTFPLSDEEQRAVDEWLAEKYPPPKQHTDGSKLPSLFDDLPAVN